MAEIDRLCPLLPSPRPRGSCAALPMASGRWAPAKQSMSAGLAGLIDQGDAWAAPAYRILIDPDGRPSKLKRARHF
jgi:hypothetical protein